jgi:hypothetical protein
MKPVSQRFPLRSHGAGPSLCSRVHAPLNRGDNDVRTLLRRPTAESHFSHHQHRRAAAAEEPRPKGILFLIALAFGQLGLFTALFAPITIGMALKAAACRTVPDRGSACTDRI